jgi:transcriptional regulator GlxA family with amidase domain
MDPRITTVRLLIERNPLTSQESLAAAVNLSHSRLRRLFRRESSVTLCAYVRQVRLEGAVRLLRETFLSVKEIAAASGFNDQCHFVRTFRRQFGAPPGRYRSLSTERDCAGHVELRDAGSSSDAAAAWQESRKATPAQNTEPLTR